MYLATFCSRALYSHHCTRHFHCFLRFIRALEPPTSLYHRTMNMLVFTTYDITPKVRLPHHLQVNLTIILTRPTTSNGPILPTRLRFLLQVQMTNLLFRTSLCTRAHSSISNTRLSELHKSQNTIQLSYLGRNQGLL
jgi:hypothetical protein